MTAFGYDQESDDNAQKGKYLTFVLGSETYALEIVYVTEIIGIQAITPVPDMPSYIRGVINLRGRVLPVMDVRLRFGMAEREYDGRTCIIVIHARDSSTGLVVDTVNEVLEIHASQIDDPYKATTGAKKGRFIKGLGRVEAQIKIILDAEMLIFESEENLSLPGGGFP